jgi:hypothetical protein
MEKDVIRAWFWTRLMIFIFGRLMSQAAPDHVTP